MLQRGKAHLIKLFGFVVAMSIILVHCPISDIVQAIRALESVGIARHAAAAVARSGRINGNCHHSFSQEPLFREGMISPLIAERC